jgi:hypothetical protein
MSLIAEQGRTPHWVAFLTFLYAAACFWVLLNAGKIRKIAARMRPGPRQRMLARPGYTVFVRGVALFGLVMGFVATYVILTH